MSDRTFSLTVLLDGEYRDDDAQVIIDAISMIKGVEKVIPKISESADYLAYARARNDLHKKLFKVLEEDK